MLLVVLRYHICLGSQAACFRIRVIVVFVLLHQRFGLSNFFHSLILFAALFFLHLLHHLIHVAHAGGRQSALGALFVGLLNILLNQIVDVNLL